MNALRSLSLEMPVEVKNWKKWVNLIRYISITAHIVGKRFVLVFLFFEHAINHLSSSCVHILQFEYFFAFIPFFQSSKTIYF